MRWHAAQAVAWVVVAPLAVALAVVEGVERTLRSERGRTWASAVYTRRAR